MTLAKETIAFAAQFGAAYPGSEATVRSNGGLVHGVSFACYLHPELADREHYLGPERAAMGCTIVLNDTVAYHVDDHGEVWHTEDAGWFRYRAQRWLQPWRTGAQIRKDAAVELARPWLWEGLVKPGLVTLLVAPPKLGKTTLVFDLLSAMAGNKGACVGQSVNLANVLYVSEEGEVPIAYKLEQGRNRAVERAGYIAFLTSYEAGGDWAGL